MNKANCITLKTLRIFIAMTVCASLSHAGDIQKNNSKDLSLSGRLLTPGVSISSGAVSSMPIVAPEPLINDVQWQLNGFGIRKTPVKGLSHEIGRVLDQAGAYFFKHFLIQDYSSVKINPQPELKNKIRAMENEPEKIQFNLCVDIGYYPADIINIDAIRLESHFDQTFVTTIYRHDSKKFEFSVGNARINRMLIQGMKLELQANPYENSGAVLLTMAL